MIHIDKFIYCIIKLGKIHNFYIKSYKTTNIDKLRKFHNYIKYQLIIDSCLKTNAISLLDIACGRGGDLQKWLDKQLKLKYILAMDNHRESIYNSIKNGNSFDGAIARFNNLKYYYNKTPFIKFIYADILDDDIKSKLNKIDSNKLYDVISCQFALHYFCEDDIKLNNVLKLISSKLNKDGLFIGTATDGDLIKKILDNGPVDIPLLNLTKKNLTNYLFYINTNKNTSNKTQNYFQIKGISSEYYLFKKKLNDLALNNNLKLIKYESFYDWYQKYDKNYLTLYEMLISFLNFSFIFQKF
tara:strand:+ start:279 stop:1175 length:897 start_codon:yes stop_codon:yes gene_type:complete